MSSKKDKLLQPVKRLLHRPSPSPLVDPDDTNSASQPLLTVEEAKAAKKYSRAYDNFISAFHGFTSLAKLVEPCLEGTPFKAPTAVFIAIADAIETAKANKEDVDEALKSISDRVQVVAKYFAQSEDEGSQLILDEYAKELVSDAQQIDEIRNMSRLERINTKSNKSKLEDLISRIDKRTVDLHIRISLETERDTKEIRERLLRNGLKSWNRAPSAQYKADVVENQPTRGGCTEGTRVDILQRITDWANDPSSPSIFWLSGMAGSGKSTIAYTVCQRFSQDDASRTTLGASFFCSRQVPELRRLGNIIPTLVYQLTRRSRSFGKALDSVDQDIVDVSSEHVEKLLLEPWKRSARNRPAELPPILIVIDAVDEIENDGGTKLLSNLVEATSRMAGVQQLKILVTSRPHPNIVASTAQLNREAVYRLEDIVKEDGREDILKFLVEKLPDLVPKHGHLLEALADRSDGLFIYAATAVRVLFPPDSLNPLSSQERQKALSRFLGDASAAASDLDNVYDLYKQVLRDAIPVKHRPSRLLILHRIICTKQPLPISALARLEDVDGEDDVDADAHDLLVKALHAVLHVSAADNCVYVYHKSFYDFMLDIELSGTDLACAEDAQDRSITQACLSIMQNSLRFNMCDLPSSYLLDSEVSDLGKRVAVGILDVVGLEYACHFWTSHLIGAHEFHDRSQLVYEQLLAFMSENVIFWMEAVNLLDVGASSYQGLSHVKAWIESQPNVSADLKVASTCALRLAHSFFWTAASSSTPHLYISCLATELSMHPDTSSHWKSQFLGIPQIHCSGIGSQAGVLTRIDLKERVNAVAFSPDGTHVVVGFGKHFLRAYNASTGAEMRTFEGHSDVISSVAFFINGLRIVSGSWDKSVRIWDALNTADIKTLNGHTDRVVSVSVSCDGARIASCSWDSTVRLWDASSGTLVHNLVGHTGLVHSVMFSPDGERVISGADDCSVWIWDASTGAEMGQLYGHTDYVTSVAFSPDGMLIASASDDISIRVWEPPAEEEVQIFDDTSSNGNQIVVFSPRGKHIASSSSGPSSEFVRIWDVSTGEKVQDCEGHEDTITSISFSPDGTRMASGSWDNSVRIWDVSSVAKTPTLDGHGGSVSHVAFSPDGTRVISGSEDESIRIWDVSTGTEIQKIGGLNGTVTTFACTSDGLHVISNADNEHVMRMWAVSTGAEVQTYEGHTDIIASIAFSPDGRRAVSGSADYSVRIWDLSSGAEVHMLSGHKHRVTAVAFFPDSTCVVSSSLDRSVRIWDASSGIQVSKLDHPDSVTAVALSPDSSRVVSGSGDKLVRLWDVSSGEVVRELSGHTAWVSCLVFSHDGARVASASTDHTVRVWDASSGVEMYRLDGHTKQVASVAFSPDSQRLVSGSWDRSVRVWNTAVEQHGTGNRWSLDRTTSWVVRQQTSERLLWLPPHLHEGLHDGSVCTLVISQATKARVDLDFGNACVGPNWASCYKVS